MTTRDLVWTAGLTSPRGRHDLGCEVEGPHSLGGRFHHAQISSGTWSRSVGDRDEAGASAVEYGLLIGGIAALVLTAVFALGPVISEQFSDTCASVKSETGAATTATC